MEAPKRCIFQMHSPNILMSLGKTENHHDAILVYFLFSTSVLIPSHSVICLLGTVLQQKQVQLCSQISNLASFLQFQIEFLYGHSLCLLHVFLTFSKFHFHCECLSCGSPFVLGCGDGTLVFNLNLVYLGKAKKMLICLSAGNVCSCSKEDLYIWQQRGTLGGISQIFCRDQTPTECGENICLSDPTSWSLPFMSNSTKEATRQQRQGPVSCSFP